MRRLATFVMAGIMVVMVFADERPGFASWLKRQIATYTPSAEATAADRAGQPERWDPTRVKEAGAALAREIWPVGDLPADQLDWFCQRIAARPYARTLVYWHARAQVAKDRVILSGATNVAVLRDTLAAAVREVGYDAVDNQLRRLPDMDRLGARPFGVCRVAHALTYDRPGGGDARLQTDLLYGEPVWLLDTHDEHLLVHAGDGYWGWVVASAVERLTPGAFDAYLKLPVATLIDPQSRAGATIPAGARLRIVDRTETRLTVRTPDGATAELPAAAVRVLDPTPAIQQRIRAALKMLDTPYVFGGRSAKGTDCSGFVTNILGQGGAVPARDAWQQSLAGQLVATTTHREAIRAGDLLYFINAAGHVHHTGMALTPTVYVHASPPCVRINSLDPGDRLYSPRLDRQFFMAKRP